MFRIVLSGDWSEGRVTTQPVESTRLVVPAAETAIDTAWAEALARPAIHLFDGPMCRIESIDNQPRSLHLNWSPTSYRIFWGTNMANPQLAEKFAPEVMANPIGLSTAVISNDGQLLLGRRNDRVAYYPKRVHPVAGCMEPSDATPFDGIRRELREELGLDGNQIARLRCIGMAMDTSLAQTELIFVADVSPTAAELRQSLDAAEHHGFWTSPATEPHIVAALDRDADFTPIAMATLLLYLLAGFGQIPFNQMSRSLRQDGRLICDAQNYFAASGSLTNSSII